MNAISDITTQNSQTSTAKNTTDYHWPYKQGQLYRRSGSCDPFKFKKITVN